MRESIQNRKTKRFDEQGRCIFAYFKEEVGGFAKLKTLIDEKKKENPDTLILDGGDFSMVFAAISTFFSFCDAQKSSVPGGTLQVDIIRFT